ncbi:MAG: response regulator transcription factor [bacterium]
MKVLIIDDSQVVVERLTEMISELNDLHVVGNAACKVEGIGKFRKLKPDIVILDLHLEKSKGIDVLNKIKEESPATIVIVLTNYPENYNRTACLKAGANYFLDKSCEFEKVNEICDRLASHIA